MWHKRNRTRVLLVSGVIVLILALVDWRTKPYFSIGFLYLFPIMLAAGFLPRWVIALLSIACAVLSEVFSSLDPAGQSIRLVFEALAIAGSGMFVGELIRNRRLTSEANERLRILVETSPAAILTTHTILAATVPVLAIITLRRGLKGAFVRHKAIARWTLPIWLYVSVTGVVVYLMLYQF